MVEAFADAVLNDGPVPLGNEDSIANMRVLDALALSARTGQRQSV
jgi:predicted dehydrogenase